MPIGEDELQPHLGMPRETFRDDLAEQRLRERYRRRHAQSPSRILGPRRESAPRLLDRPERRTTRTEVSLTRPRELHVARRSVKEARAERALEPGDPPARRRSRHAQHISSCLRSSATRTKSSTAPIPTVPLMGHIIPQRAPLVTRHRNEYLCRK
jgi:hypothetical protein